MNDLKVTVHSLTINTGSYYNPDFSSFFLHSKKTCHIIGHYDEFCINPLRMKQRRNEVKYEIKV